MPKPKIDRPQRRVKELSAKWPYTRGPDFRIGVGHVPTDELRERVRKLAAMGALQPDIALVLRIDQKTLRKHYREELDVAATEANEQVAGWLFDNCRKGNVIAQLFWLKARGGWVDRREVNHNHSIGPTLTHEERLRLLEAGPDEIAPPMIDGEADDVSDGDDGADFGPEIDGEPDPE